MAELEPFRLSCRRETMKGGIMKKAVPMGLAALLVLAALYLLVGNPVVAWHNRALKEAVTSISGRETVTLNEIVPFDWDVVYTFDPYASREEIEKTIGCKSRSIRESVSEGMVQLVFVKGNAVTASVCGYPGNLGYSIVFNGQIARGDEVSFAVDETASAGIRLVRQ